MFNCRDSVALIIVQKLSFFCPYSSYVHLRNLFHHTRLHTTDEDHSFEVTFCKSVGNILLLKSVNQTLFSQKKCVHNPEIFDF